MPSWEIPKYDSLKIIAATPAHQRRNEKADDRKPLVLDFEELEEAIRKSR